MPAASVVTIASFPTSTGDGNDPDGQLFIDSNGDLFGATVHGGTDPNPNNQIGTTYEITKIAGSFATTPTFLADLPTGLNTLAGPNGNVPNLSADADGDLFGLEITGGANNLGAVVEFPAGGGSPITLATTFPSGAGNPGGRLLIDTSGNLFGTTLSGKVFEIQKTPLAMRPRQPSLPASAQASFPLARAIWSKTRWATFLVRPPARCSKSRRPVSTPMLLRSASPLPGGDTDRHSHD